MTSAEDKPILDASLIHSNKPDQLPDDRRTQRQKYLAYIGLKWDVLAQPSAEQEYAFVESEVLRVPPDPALLTPFSHDIPAVFPYAYYVDPRYDDRRDGSVFDELRTPGHAFVFGRPGDGKSTLRLAVEAYARAYPDRTLIVTYQPGRDVEQEVKQAMTAAGEPPAGDQPHPDQAAAETAARDAHLRLLAAALAVDLFIQVIEQFGYRPELPSERQNHALCYLITNVEPRLKAVLDRLMRGDEPDGLWGFAWLWRRLGRTVVRPVTRTPQMKTWFAELRRQAPGHDESHPSGLALWQQALDAARLWGFQRVYVMLDGLDTYWRRPPDMTALLDPLLRLLRDFSAQSVSLKAFLPRELQEEVMVRLVAYGVAPGEVSVLLLEWTNERLDSLLMARYRAGGSRRLGVADLVEEELSDGFDERLLEAARGSPRRLLLILHELVEAHIADTEQPVERPITREEWNKAVERAEARMAV